MLGSNLLSSEFWTKLGHRMFQITQNISRPKADCVLEKDTTVNSSGQYNRKYVLTNISNLFWKSKTMPGKKRKLWEGCDTLPDSHTHFHIGRYIHTNTHGHRQGYPTNKADMYVQIIEHLVRGVLLFIWSRFEQDCSAFGENKQWVLSIISFLVYSVRKYCNNAAVE